ncbi:nucleotidyltransferase family protein [Saccharospirillum salsuginis]|uniref:Polymerase beta nucleotidyltransferase domain-containing protein n=1 Tax=Saccharospirillum salsuginis TaxID=418750 RepID=A0A918K9A8_9GAMM|nr:nucleotidyltransferase domain-containing protein [Saccharospirillum salsuginis]GGX55402.1 hypothetical protein GCM10007392_23850 [Saccharospirillum salsuginis]
MNPVQPPIDVTPEQWLIIQRILQRHLAGYDVWAFGSRARGTARPFSDLDLAVITEKPLTMNRLSALTSDFSESDLPWKVDVVDWSTLSDSFKQIISRDKVVLQHG